MSPILAPSILASDHARLADGAAAAAKLGLEWIHIDIMDGHFVPNLSFGPGTVAALRSSGSTLFFDTHLMVTNPDLFVEAFAKAGSSRLIIHIEPSFDHVAVLRRIRDLGCRPGIALNPGTPAEAVESLLTEVDLVLAMTVQPGFGGQAFRSDVLPKIAVIDGWRKKSGLEFRIEVDGGVDLATAAECRAAGADTFVIGTAFFKDPDKPALCAAIASL